MDLSIFIISVFCLIDDWLEGEPKLRQRGPHPELPDSEVLTIEIVGEFLGIDSEKDLFAYFRHHYGEWFPALREVYRTAFTRQAARPRRPYMSSVKWRRPQRRGSRPRRIGGGDARHQDAVDLSGHVTF